MRRYRNKRFARRNYKRYYRVNNYFRQHGEQTTYAKLNTAKNTVKRVVTTDGEVFIHQGMYSLSQSTGTYANMLSYETSLDFQRYAQLYQQYRVVGLKINIYKATAPNVLVSESTDVEFGLLGLNVSIGQPNNTQSNTIESDTTFWLSQIGWWMSLSKYFSFTSRFGGNEVTEWQPTSQVNKPIWLSIATKGNPELPSGWKIFYLSFQFMMEFANPL